MNVFLPASAAESAASAAIEKLNEPGVENNLLSAGPIKKGGAVCECRLFSMSSSLFELLKAKSRINFRLNVNIKFKLTTETAMDFGCVCMCQRFAMLFT